MDKETLRKHLENDVRRRERFCLPYTSDQAREFLATAYHAEVTKRGAYSYTSTPEIEKNMDAVAKWLTTATRKPGIILAGTTPGTGKTTMARAICSLSKILSSEKEGLPRFRFVSASKVEEIYTAAAAVKQAHPGEDVATYDAVERYSNLVNYPYLFVDDLGIERRTVKIFGVEYTPAIDFITARYDAGLATSITTNLSLEHIAERYGLRVADRLREGCEVLAFNGKTFRL